MTLPSCNTFFCPDLNSTSLHLIATCYYIGRIVCSCAKLQNCNAYCNKHQNLRSTKNCWFVIHCFILKRQQLVPVGLSYNTAAV